MKKILVLLLIAGLSFGIALTGCGQKAESSGEAINTAKTMETVQEKTQYLIGQAKAFYSSKEFQDAVDVAQYVLRYLDKDSQEAKNLLAKAKEALTAKAKSAVADVKKQLPDFGQ